MRPLRPVLPRQPPRRLRRGLRIRKFRLIRCPHRGCRGRSDRRRSEMRWALVGVALLLAVAGLLYRGGAAFVSTLSDGPPPRGVGGPVAAAAVESPTRPAPGPGGPLAATAALATAPSPANPA